MSALEKLKQINNEIANGLSVADLVKIRKKIYKIAADSDEEFILKHQLLACIAELIHD